LHSAAAITGRWSLGLGLGMILHHTAQAAYVLFGASRRSMH
jgi:hypothetical protein